MTPATRPSKWSGTLALGSGLVAYHGPGSSAARHRHDAIQIVWGLESPVVLRLGDEELEARAAIVPARSDHTLEAGPGDLVVLLAEPSGAIGAALGALADDEAGSDLSGRLRSVLAPPQGPADPLLAWARAMLDTLLGDDYDVHDGRLVRPEVAEAVRYVDDASEGVPRLTEAAAHVALSPRQLSRSVTHDIGMPFRRYVLWSRLRRVVVAVRGGDDLTTAALSAGFADSAHLSRVFKSTFGLSPSEVLPLVEVAEVVPWR